MSCWNREPGRDLLNEDHDEEQRDKTLEAPAPISWKNIKKLNCSIRNNIKRTISYGSQIWDRRGSQRELALM